MFIMKSSHWAWQLYMQIPFCGLNEDFQILYFSLAESTIW